MQKILLVSYFGLSVVFGPQLLAQAQPGDPDKGITSPDENVSLIFLLRDQFSDQSALADAGFSAHQDDTAAGRIQIVQQPSQHR